MAGGAAERYPREATAAQIARHNRPHKAAPRLARLDEALAIVAASGLSADLRTGGVILLVEELRDEYYHWGAGTPEDKPQVFHAATVLLCELLTCYWRAKLGVTSGPPAVLVADETETGITFEVHD